MAKIIIDGVEHDFTPDFDIGEARVIKRYTGLNLQQIEGEDAADPDLIAAFLHIVFRREEPTLSFADLEAKVDAVKLASMDIREDEVVELNPPVVLTPSETPFSAGETGKLSNGSQDPSPETESPATTGRPLSGIS